MKDTVPNITPPRKNRDSIWCCVGVESNIWQAAETRIRGKGNAQFIDNFGHPIENTDVVLGQVVRDPTRLDHPIAGAFCPLVPHEKHLC